MQRVAMHLVGSANVGTNSCAMWSTTCTPRHTMRRIIVLGEGPVVRETVFGSTCLFSTLAPQSRCFPMSGASVAEQFGKAHHLPVCVCVCMATLRKAMLGLRHALRPCLGDCTAHSGMCLPPSASVRESALAAALARWPTIIGHGRGMGSICLPKLRVACDLSCGKVCSHLLGDSVAVYGHRPEHAHGGARSV